MARTLGVVIPHYNDSRFLADAVESCARGERPADRVLIIDDGSRPEEFAAVERIVAALRQRHGARIDLVRQPGNRGVVPALNRGLAEIGTDCVLFRAADDRTLPGFFTGIMQLLEQSPDAGLGVADLRYYTQSPVEGVVESIGLPRAGYFAPGELARHLSPTCILHSGTTVFSRRALEAAGGFLPDTDLYHDWWACHQLAFRHGLAYWPHAGTAFRLRADSVSSRCYQDLPRAHRSIAAVRARLAAETAGVRDGFARAGLLDFFAAVENRPTETRLHRSHDHPAGGIEAVLRRRLESLAPALRGVAGKTYVFGAGNHTRALLREWRRLQLPALAGLVVTRPDAGEFDGLPVFAPADLSLQQDDLLVLSSKSFEEAMAATAAESFPRTPLLSFWNPAHTTLPTAAAAGAAR